jgi:hypothetical protein
MPTRLLSVVLHWKKNQLEALVERNGVRRKVAVSWQSKDPTDVPPEHWFQMVTVELDVQDAERFAKERGALPGY